MKVIVGAAVVALQLAAIACGLPDARLGDSLEEFQRQNFGAGRGYHHGEGNFHCAATAPSPTIPTSVHALRPADIKVVGALGDSLTAANGAGAHSILGVALEYRGLAFSIGGDKDLSRSVTLPNILRTFNAHLFGQSFGIAPVSDYIDSQLNIGVPGARSTGLMEEARGLVRRMREHPADVDFARDWKLITIFIGGNDLCAYCHNRHYYSPERWFQRINDTLDYLYRHVPRAIVQVVGILHVELLREVERAYFWCKVLHVLECPCSTNALAFPDAEFKAVIDAYQRAELQLGADGTFDDRDDFTVVVQPFFRHSKHLPTHSNGNPDLSYFAPDCFHFSQKSHEHAARALWNNMLEPVGQKTDYYNFSSVNQVLKCPDAACPFIRTSKNSRDCQHGELFSAEGRQTKSDTDRQDGTGGVSTSTGGSFTVSAPLLAAVLSLSVIVSVVALGLLRKRQSRQSQVIDVRH